jgi:integrase
VALERADIETARQGLVVTIRRSKTDQEGAGRRIGIPHGRTRFCPVAAVEAWLAASCIDTGPLFRPITRHGQVLTNSLTGDAVSVLLRERLKLAGIDREGYSGHSLRAGFATSAAQAGVSTLTIDRVESGMPCRMDTKRKIILALGMTVAEKDQVFVKTREDADAADANDDTAAVRRADQHQRNG